MKRFQTLPVNPGPRQRAGTLVGSASLRIIAACCAACLLLLVAGCASNSSSASPAPPTDKEKQEGAGMRQQMRMQRGKPAAGPNPGP